MRSSPRTPMFVVDKLEEAVAIAATHGDAVILDVDNTLVHYGSSKTERGEAMTDAVEMVARSGLNRLAFITNGRNSLPRVHHESLDIHSVTGARKPYVRLPPLKRFREVLAGATVYGDQPLTDGKLARNLGGIWIQPRHAHEPEEVEPWWPRVMRQAGQKAMARHFELATVVRDQHYR